MAGLFFYPLTNNSKARKDVYSVRVLFIIGIIILCLLLLFLLLLFMKITVKIRYYHAKDNDDLSVEIKILFGLIRIKKKFPLIKVDDNSPSLVVKEETKVKVGEDGPEQRGNKKTNQFTGEDLLNTFSNTKELIQHVVGFHRIIRYILSKVRIKDIEWSSIIGLGDAAHTGAISGAVWAVKGAIIGIISNYMKMQNMPHIHIYPQFQRNTSETLFKCMIRFRLGHAMIAGIKIVKYWKGGMPHFKTNNEAPAIQK